MAKYLMLQFVPWDIAGSVTPGNPLAAVAASRIFH